MTIVEDRGSCVVLFQTQETLLFFVVFRAWGFKRLWHKSYPSPPTEGISIQSTGIADPPTGPSDRRTLAFLGPETGFDPSAQAAKIR